MINLNHIIYSNCMKSLTLKIVTKTVLKIFFFEKNLFLKKKNFFSEKTLVWEKHFVRSYKVDLTHKLFFTTVR